MGGEQGILIQSREPQAEGFYNLQTWRPGKAGGRIRRGKVMGVESEWRTKSLRPQTRKSQQRCLGKASGSLPRERPLLEDTWAGNAGTHERLDPQSGLAIPEPRCEGCAPGMLGRPLPQ